LVKLSTHVTLYQTHDLANPVLVPLCVQHYSASDLVEEAKDRLTAQVVH